MQGQRDDAAAVSCVVTMLPLLAGRPSAAGAVMTAAASSAPISIVPVDDLPRTTRQCGTLILSLCLRLLDLSAIADGGFRVKHCVLKMYDFAHRRRLVATENGDQPFVMNDCTGFSSSSLNTVGRSAALRRSPAAKERRLL